MDGFKASMLHASLAHALIGVWIRCPLAQSVLHSELALWRTRKVDVDEDFFLQIASRFEVMSVERDEFDALQGAEPAHKHLDEIFDRLSRLVRKRYMAVADWGAKERIELMISWIGNPPYPDKAPLGALGAAACMPAKRKDDDNPAQVKLIFAPSLLGPPSWAAVPFLLCHELVCHATQGAPMDSSDPFAEGWMDLIAQRLHDRWLDKVFPWAPKFARTCADELSCITRQRGPDLPDLHSNTRAARAMGRQAALLIEEALRVVRHPSSRSPSRALERLSLQLNRVSSTVTDRWSFVAKIMRLLDRPETQLDRNELEQRVRLRRCLQGWVAGEVPASEVLFFS